MTKIINKLNRRLMINLKGGKNVDLLAGGSLEIAADDISSPHLQAFIKAGKVKIENTQKKKEEVEGEMTQHREELIEKKRRP